MLSRPVCVLLALIASAFLAPPAFGQAQRCVELNRLSLPGIVIRSATPVPAGTFTPPASPARSVPAFCRVVGTVLPELGFELWLPDQWNRKYVGVGNGGLAGNIVYSAMFDPLNRGYAVGSTDTGHTGANTNDGSWALGHMDRVINFGQRGVHVMAMADKLIIQAHYGSHPLHSYFQGCSYGGKQALTEVQKYPTDFDGVIAGDPANWWTRHYSGAHLWVAQALEGDGYIPASKVPVIADAVNAACDALDGVRDGVLNDPRRCHFDPAELRCKSGGAPGNNYSDQSHCLTGAQVEAVRKIWNGPRDSEGQLYPGIERGGEAGPGGWTQWITGRGPGQGGHTALGLPFMKYVVYEDPNWDFRTFRYEAAPGFETDVEYIDDKLGRVFNAIDPDLRPFRANGGKLIQYHGWSDPDIPPANSINYYESVVRRLDRNNNASGLRETREFYRLFMVPGMQHCAGGPGPTRFDALTALEQWVEQNRAPEQMTAAHLSNGLVDRTRPLCAFPQEAKYKGTGSSDDAANFVCAAP
jgi:feruloyl esterase